MLVVEEAGLCGTTSLFPKLKLVWKKIYQLKFLTKEKTL
jgi:hypothetical protein